MSLRGVILARAVELHGSEKGCKAHLARLVAPRWGLMPDRAEEKIHRFLRGQNMGSRDLEVLLDVLGLEVAPRASSDVTVTE